MPSRFRSFRPLALMFGLNDRFQLGAKVCEPPVPQTDF
jgi:hypothetical protein